MLLHKPEYKREAIFAEWVLSYIYKAEIMKQIDKLSDHKKDTGYRLSEITTLWLKVQAAFIGLVPKCMFVIKTIFF